MAVVDVDTTQNIDIGLQDGDNQYFLVDVRGDDSLRIDIREANRQPYDVDIQTTRGGRMASAVETDLYSSAIPNSPYTVRSTGKKTIGTTKIGRYVLINITNNSGGILDIVGRIHTHDRKDGDVSPLQFASDTQVGQTPHSPYGFVDGRGLGDIERQSVDYIDNNLLSSEPPFSEGRLYYDEGKKALTYMNDISDMRVNLGLEVFFRVRNDDSTDIEQGDVVYISGATGSQVRVKKANASNTDIVTQTFGVATTTMGRNNSGWIVVIGEVSNIDTSSYSEGDDLWLDNSDGGLIDSQPSFPDIQVKIGTVVRANNDNGRIQVNAAKKINRGYSAEGEPSDPPDGESVVWQSDGSGAGDEGDFMIKVTDSNGTTKTSTLFDFSAN